MALYKVSHAVARRQASAQYEVKTGALSAGSDLYRARMTAEAAQTYCGTNLACAGFTWQSATKAAAAASAKEKDELPLIFFKGGESTKLGPRARLLCRKRHGQSATVGVEAAVEAAWRVLAAAASAAAAAAHGVPSPRRSLPRLPILPRLLILRVCPSRACQASA